MFSNPNPEALFPQWKAELKVSLILLSLILGPSLAFCKWWLVVVVEHKLACVLHHVGRAGQNGLLIILHFYSGFITIHILQCRIYHINNSVSTFCPVDISTILLQYQYQDICSKIVLLCFCSLAFMTKWHGLAFMTRWHGLKIRAFFKAKWW